MYGANVIIFEGILTFYNPEICSVSAVNIFTSFCINVQTNLSSYWI